ncbi:MAG: FAD-dependent oxidoreductase, partial [Mycobacteriaceae bacterium]|nr:FAD-dependent oxidoreductase [Mycobacteriaceae bacterium]
SAHRLDAVITTAPQESVCGLLIRPDGYVAWAADEFEEDDERRLHAALRRWIGS